MRLQTSLLDAAVASVIGWMRSLLAHAVELLTISPAHTYHPEAHYMRGPGPKWREKHAPPA